MLKKSKISMKVLLMAILFASVSCATMKKNVEQAQDPNIVMILVDDLGYSDLAYVGFQEGLNTPNIDKLAENGMVFNQAYAAAPVCSPTRASILTGKSPAALKLTCHIPGLPMDQYFERQHEGKTLTEAFFKDHLASTEVTIADKLQNHGYTTGFFGKWHLAGSGSARSQSDGIIDTQFHPEHQGFDVNIGGCAYGQPSSWFAPYRNATIEDKEDGEYLTDRMRDEATNFISQNKDKPFFLYLSTYTVHTPLKAPQDVIENNNGDVYHAMIEKLDQNVGKVIDQLESLNLLENTMIVFYSDNGGLWGNPPLREHKGSLHEGGIRVPLVVNWLGKINAGRSETPVTSVDLFPTFLDAVGVSANIEGLEGQSLWPLLHKDSQLEDRALYWHFPHYRNGGIQDMGAVIREGDWKLIWDLETDEKLLYNLADDEAESSNVADENEEKRNDLLVKLKKWQEEVDAEMPENI